MKLKILSFLFLSQAFLSAQIDTTDWFPLKIGNYWEYAAITNYGPVYFGTTVMGDTLIRMEKHIKFLKKNISILLVSAPLGILEKIQIKYIVIFKILLLVLTENISI